MPQGATNARKNMTCPFDRATFAPYYPPAMATPLHQYVSPQDLAERQQILEYNGNIGEFERLSEIAAADLAADGAAPGPEEWRGAPVAIRLQFAWADARQEVPMLSGQVAAEMPAVCQRCLKAFRYTLENDVKMAIVAGSAGECELADRPGTDVWEIEQDKLRLIDVVEEALIMAMPLAPMHGDDHPCGRSVQAARESSVDKVTPFADLKTHMDKMNR